MRAIYNYRPLSNRCINRKVAINKLKLVSLNFRNSSLAPTRSCIKYSSNLRQQPIKKYVTLAKKMIIIYTSSMIILIILLIFCFIAMGIALLMIHFLKETNSRPEEVIPEGRNPPYSCNGKDRRSAESFCWISTDPRSTLRSMPRLQYQHQEEFFSFNTFKPELSESSKKFRVEGPEDIKDFLTLSKHHNIYPVPNINSLRRSDLTVYYV